MKNIKGKIFTILLGLVAIGIIAWTLGPIAYAYFSIIRDIDTWESKKNYRYVYAIPETSLFLQTYFYNDSLFTFVGNDTIIDISTWNIGSSTATIYLSDGSSKDYAACTYPSDVEKFPTIPEGEYEAYVGMHNQKYLALKMRDIGAQMQTIQLGFVNPAYDDGRTYAIGVDIHKAGRDNFTGIGRDLNAVSEACFLIDIHSWDNFMSHFTSQPIGTIIGIQASRSYSKPINANIYPVFNFIYNYYRKSYLHPLMMK